MRYIERDLKSKIMDLNKEYAAILITGAFSVLDRATTPRGSGAIICMRPELSAVDSNNLIVPVWYI